jgi:hypothetical protein
LRHEKLLFFLGGLRRVATYALVRAGPVFCIPVAPARCTAFLLP